MQDFYKTIIHRSAGKERKILIVFDYMISDMIHNKNLKYYLNCLLEAEN